MVRRTTKEMLQVAMDIALENGDEYEADILRSLVSGKIGALAQHVFKAAVDAQVEIFVKTAKEADHWKEGGISFEEPDEGWPHMLEGSSARVLIQRLAKAGFLFRLDEYGELLRPLSGRTVDDDDAEDPFFHDDAVAFDTFVQGAVVGDALQERFFEDFPDALWDVDDDDDDDEDDDDDDYDEE